MKLINIRIKNYKIISETEPVMIDPHVTALVGKNESGKTAILKALWKTNNVANTTFDKLYDYPRDRYSRDRKATQEITVLDFELSSEEADDLLAQVPQLMGTEPIRITYTTFYKGEDQICRETQVYGLGGAATSAAAIAVIEDLAAVIPEESSEDHEALRTSYETALEQIIESAPLWERSTIDALGRVDAEVKTWLNTDASRADVAITERERLSEIITRARHGDPWDTARAWAERNLPIFIYFDNYGQLETRIHLPTYLRSMGDLNPRTRTQTALFKWSRLDPQEILDLGLPRQEGETDDQVHRRLEKRRALLDSASFALTGDWIKWWTEKRHKLHFDADGEDLVLKISDQHNEFPIPFEERSHGFQWFFSFCLVLLAESWQTDKGAVLLLDEPGLHLHPALQKRLIDLFERISGDNQLLYSTHLPFLVDGNHLERVRTVHLGGPEPRKTRISNDLRSTCDRDTLFPIQAALGYSIAQTFFLGKRTVIVERITDYWLIMWLVTVLPEMDGNDPLHQDTVLVPAGAASRVVPLASIMLASSSVGEGRVIVLLGSDSAGREAASRMNDVFYDEPSILVLGAALDLVEATTEDLVPRDVYADAVRRTGHEFTMNDDEKEAATNVNAMEMVFQRTGLGRFGNAEKSAAALALLNEWGWEPANIPEITQKRARALIDAINKRFAKFS